MGGGHLEKCWILRGPRLILGKSHMKNICAKFHAFLTNWIRFIGPANWSNPKRIGPIANGRRPSWKMLKSSWPEVDSRLESYEEHLCQISCLYHKLNYHVLKTAISRLTRRAISWIGTILLCLVIINPLPTPYLLVFLKALSWAPCFSVCTCFL